MFGNYLVTALRNLARNRLYAAVSILGLAVAFTAAILIGQYVRNELGYDTWIPGYARIYKIATLLQLPSRSPYLLDQPDASVKAQLEAAFPGGAAVTRLSEESLTVRRKPGDAGVAESAFAWADPNFFDLFPLPALAGDLRSALQQPDAVVLTRSAARKYFGRDLPIGGALDIRETDGRFHALRVTAVLKDLPPNTNFTTEIFASGGSAYSPMSQARAPAGPDHPFTYTFARLAPKARAAGLQRALEGMVGPYAASMKATYGPAAKASAELIALPELHFTAPSFPPPTTKPTGSRSVAYGAAGIGAMIVLVAAINFVTLMTARAGRRGVEVGVRKAAGARRSDLMVQFVGEALIQAVCSLLIGAALAELLLGPFNAFVQRGLVLDFAGDPLLLSGVLATGLGVGLVASIYPALVLSSFRPMAVLKGGLVQTSTAPVAREALVVVQFAVLVGLILSTATFYRQTEFALGKGLGTVDAKRIVTVMTPCDSAFGKEVKTLPGVAAVACSSSYALDLPDWQDATPVQGPAGNKVFFTWGHVDFDFFKLYGVRPVAGRLFSPRYGEDTRKYDPALTAEPSVVINETGARALGFTDPRKAVGQRFINFFRTKTGPPGYSQHVSVIVGVVPDMPMNVRSAPDPSYYYIMPNGWDALSIRLAGEDIPGSIKAIEATWKRTGNSKPIDEVFLSQARWAINHDLIVQRTLVGTGAGLAALIACLGLFALSAYATERRTKEIGVRKVMGADTRQVVLLLLWQFTIPVLIATAIAVPIGFVAMDWWLRGFAYHVPLSAWTFVLAAAAAVVIAWLTVSWQSFAVAKAKPAGALRYE